MNENGGPFNLEALREERVRGLRVYVGGAGCEEERNAIWERVVPVIEAYGRKMGILVSFLDMRFTAPLTPTSLFTTLQTIQTSPIFISLIGDTYGYIPDLTDPLTAHPQTWNAFPILEDWSDHSLGWLEMEVSLASKCFQNGSHPKPLIYIRRTDENPSHDPPPFTDTDFSSVLEMSFEDKLEDTHRLKDFIQSVSHSETHTTHHYHDSSNLCKTLITELKQSLKFLHPKSQNQTYNPESAQQQSYCLARKPCIWSTQMQNLQSFLDDFLDDSYDWQGEGPQPGKGTIITGPPGRGKSTFLINYLSTLATSKKQQPLVIPHFTSTTHQTRDPIHLIRSLTKTFAHTFPSYDPKPITSLSSSNPDKIFRTFADSLALISTTVEKTAFKKVVLVIDDVDDLLDVDGALELDFLPNPLPENVYVIVTAEEESMPVGQACEWGWDCLELGGFEEEERSPLIQSFTTRLESRLDPEVLDMIVEDELSEDPMYGMFVVGCLKAIQEQSWGGEFEWDSKNKSESVNLVKECKTLLEGGIPNLVTSLLSTLENTHKNITSPHFALLCSDHGVSFNVTDPRGKSHLLKSTDGATHILPSFLSLLQIFTFAGSEPILVRILELPHVQYAQLVVSLSPLLVLTESGTPSFSHPLVRDVVSSRYLSNTKTRENLANLVAEWLMREVLG
ncbi:Telomerase protein component 1, partial [Rhizophlyctis rosea]